MKSVPDLSQAEHMRAQDWRENGVAADVAQALVESFQTRHGHHVLARMMRAQVQVVTDRDPDYPALLREISNAPPYLTFLGAALADANIAVAVVGTRRCTSYGRRVALEIGRDIAKSGAVVVSGLAYGIDRAAHEGALRAGGRTVAVLGSGVRSIYPSEHRPLAQTIIASGGALYSEFLPWEEPRAYHFPQRNRIISGVSRAVIIVEAGARSGALITADFALEQNRDVAAVPGSILSERSSGCNDWIAMGATPLLRTTDVLGQLQLAPSLRRTDLCTVASHCDGEASGRDHALERVLLTELATGDKSMGELHEVPALRDLSIADMSVLLTQMELAGLVQRIQPGRYSV